MTLTRLDYARQDVDRVADENDGRVLADAAMRALAREVIDLRQRVAELEAKR